MTPAAVAWNRSVSKEQNLRQPPQMVTPTGREHKSGGGFTTESKQQQQQQQAMLLEYQMLESPPALSEDNLKLLRPRETS